MSLESKDATCVGSLCERANSHGTRDFAGDTYLQAPFRNDKRGSVNAISLDFAKAFDKVSHLYLLLKLQHYGIKSQLLE